MLALAIFGFTVIWEMRTAEPVIDFRMLGNRNFAIANVLFFVFGLGLFGLTTFDSANSPIAVWLSGN